MLYYGNIANNSASGTTTLNIPSKLSLGSYKLKVFSEQCNGDYKTDYASDFQTINLTILPKETTPNAAFTATGVDCGTLSNVDISMKYSVDGGSTWNDITNTTMEITGVTAENDVLVVKKGNGTTTSDSDQQTIDITQAAKPTVIAVDCTTLEQNDGKITGVDGTMEWRDVDIWTWTTVDGEELTDLVPETYLVRVKAKGTQLASEITFVTVNRHICVAQGNWQYDGNNHWKLCACGARVDEAAHSGGTATCTTSAVCDICSQPYGEKNPDNHTGSIKWTQTATTHARAYDCCGAVVVAEENHEWADGICSECNYECQHSGGEATCTELAVCEICNEAYGDLIPHRLALTEKQNATCSTDGKEAYYTCEVCKKHFEDETGNTEITNLDEYGVIPATEHQVGTDWKKDDSNHWNECINCGEKMNEAAHTYEWVTDKEATADEAGSKYEECTVCGYEKAAVEIPATGTTTDPTKPNQSDNTEKPADTTKEERPQTGDNSNIALWIALMLAAGATLIGTVLYRRKKTAK